MLFPRLAIRVQGEEGASVLDNAEVHRNDDHPDDQEGRVGPETVADVQFVVNLSGGDHVDDLEPDEQVEDEGHVSGRITINFCVNDRVVEVRTVELVESSREDLCVSKVNFVAKSPSKFVEA